MDPKVSLTIKVRWTEESFISSRNLGVLLGNKKRKVEDVKGVDIGQGSRWCSTWKIYSQFKASVLL